MGVLGMQPEITAAEDECIMLQLWYELRRWKEKMQGKLEDRGT